MSVLVITRRDRGGSWFHLAGCMRQRGADVRVITLDRDPALAWPADIADVWDGGQELGHLLHTSRVLHLVDLVPDDIALLGDLVPRRCAGSDGPQVVLQCDQRRSPDELARLQALAGARGWPIVTTVVQPSAVGELVAPFLPLWRAPWLPQPSGTRLRARRPTRSVFACSSRPLRERPALESMIDEAETIARGLGDVRVEVASGRAHARVLQQRRRCHLALVAGDDGFGRTGFEALAQGIVTVADLDERERAAWAALAGGMPMPIVPSRELPARMKALAHDMGPDPRLRTWVSAAADPRRWFALCERLWLPAIGRRAA